MTTFLDGTALQVQRIFKHAVFKNRERTKAFFYAVAANLLGLVGGHVLRIKSKHPKLRKELYEIFVKVNKERAEAAKNEGKEVRSAVFDFDHWDVCVELKKYIAGEKAYFIVTTEGLDKVVQDLDPEV